MRKVAAVAAVVTMSAGLLTACSGGDYCGELKNYAEASKNMDTTDTKAIETMVNESKKVSKSAPDDLKDDWKIVVEFTEKAKDAKGDDAKITELAKEYGDRMTPALEAISKQAKDTCKVDLDS